VNRLHDLLQHHAADAMNLAFRATVEATIISADGQGLRFKAPSGHLHAIEEAPKVLNKLRTDHVISR